MILLQGVALYLAVCGAVRNFGVSLDRRCSTACECRHYFAYLFLPLAFIILVESSIFHIFARDLYFAANSE